MLAVFPERLCFCRYPWLPTPDVVAAAGHGIRLSSFLSSQIPWAFDAIHVLRALNYLRPSLVIIPT